MNNQSPNNTPDIKSVKELGRCVSATDALLFALIALLLCAFLPLSLFYNMEELILEGLSIAALGASIFALYRMVGAKRPFLPITITAAAAFFFIGAPTTALVMSFMISVCSMAYVLLFADSTASKIMCAISPAASYLIAVIFTDSFATATVALVPLAAALALYYSMKENLHKVSAVCHISTAILVFICAVVSIRYISLYGTDLSVLREGIDAFRETLTDLTAQMLILVADEISDIAEISMTDATELATVSVNTMFNLLPAIIITMTNILAFFVHSMMLRVLFSEKAPSPTLKNMMLFDMSLISAIVFILSSLLTLIFSTSEISAWVVTAENLSIILIPGMVLTAIMMIRGFTMNKKGCASSLIYFAIIFSLIYAPTVMIPLAAFTGAVVVILNNIAKYKLSQK